MIVVDSNVWIDYLRRTDSDAGSRLDGFLAQREVILTGIVLAEILQGTTGDDDFEVLADALATATYVEIDRRVWLRAGRLSRQLRASGQPLPLTDVAIAAVAIDGDHRLFTFDPDFKRIPGLKLYDWTDPNA